MSAANASAGNELKTYLTSTLQELRRLTEQIRKTRDYSEQACLVNCLKELIEEQIHENTLPTDHPPR